VSVVAPPVVDVARACARDHAALVAFNLAMAMETEGKALDRAVLSRGVRRLLDDESKGFYLVARDPASPVDDDGARAIVGQLMVTTEWSDWRDQTFWWIQSVYVAPTMRGRGVYRALHEAVRALAHDDGGVCGIRLYVEHTNTGAQATYEKVGMVASHYRMYEEEPVRRPTSVHGEPT